MAKYTINQMKKVIKKLIKINIKEEKEILNLKVIELKKLTETEKLTIQDIEIIWGIQEMILNKSWFETLFKIT